ncbi:MAG TPA: tetratricopeptide repeat protein, partial [Pyrinomonadaceae bacterium]
PDTVVHGLVGEAFSRLDPAAQQVMQALAVYGHPVTAAALDYLSQPHLPGIDSAPVLKRLVNMQFARREKGHYYLHPVDRIYALSRIPRGEPSDRLKRAEPGGVFFLPDEVIRIERVVPPYTQFALLHRAAEYFKRSGLPREDWKTIEDLAPQLAEFNLRCEGEDYDTAAYVLLTFTDHLHSWGFYRQLMEMHERVKGRLSDSNLEASIVGGLGSVYWRTGHVQNAIGCYEKALKLERDNKNRAGEEAWLGNLGNCYSDMGQIAEAIRYYEEASVIAREIGDREGEGIAAANVAEVLVDEKRYVEAIQKAMEGVKIGEDINRPMLGSFGNRYLALARLYDGDLAGARAAIETARLYDEPSNYEYVLSLLGVIAFKQGDVSAAKEAYRQAVAQAEAMLARSAQNYMALDSKGLALCGLTVCGDADHAAEAAEAFRAARAINKESGVVGRVLRLFDTLTESDTAVGLAAVRAAAAGE